MLKRSSSVERRATAGVCGPKEHGNGIDNFSTAPRVDLTEAGGVEVVEGVEGVEGVESVEVQDEAVGSVGCSGRRQGSRWNQGGGNHIQYKRTRMHHWQRCGIGVQGDDGSKRHDRIGGAVQGIKVGQFLRHNGSGQSSKGRYQGILQTCNRERRIRPSAKVWNQHGHSSRDQKHPTGTNRHGKTGGVRVVCD